MVAVLAAGLGTARPVYAGSGADLGWGLLSVLSNALYMPGKVTYALLGGLTGGLAYALTGGDAQTAQTVWLTSLGGTYVLTPAMLRGEERIAFAGGLPADGPQAAEETETETVYEFREAPLGDG
jgi:fermentation-respiration switch protein FrsA (DUF1100 family)